MSICFIQIHSLISSFETILEQKIAIPLPKSRNNRKKLSDFNVIDCSDFLF